MFGRKRKEEIQNLLESAQKDRTHFAEQAEKDRKAILEQIGSIKNNATNDVKAPAIEKGQELKAAYALNLCTVSVSQIIDYNDLAIMEQEYDNILNNLNLQNFPKDEALLKILKQILDVISFFRIQDGEKKLLEEQYKKKVKNAIWSAVPSPSVILASGGKAGWVGLAVSAISAVGTGYMNYRKERATIDDEKREKDWELQKAALEQFHALRRELFDTAWRLADTYNFHDAYRLTARQISQYNGILMEEDAEKRYERLEYIASQFKAYPPFWYNLGHAAADVFHNNKHSEELCIKFKTYALSAFDEFMKLTDEDKKNSLLREDPLRAACALEKFALLSDEKSVSVDDKVALLQTAAKNSGNAFDTLQLCATSYLELGIYEEAIKLLRMLVNEGYNAEMNAQLLSILYISLIKKDGQKYKHDHETLYKRDNEEYMFPWPEEVLDDDSAKNYTNAFLDEQNRRLFEKYKGFVGEYLNQCKRVFDDIIAQPGDITESIVGFLNGIKKDLETLFGDEAFSQNICEKMAEELLKYQNLFCDDRKRKEIKDFSFDTISKKSIIDIANRIKDQVNKINNEIAYEEKIKTMSSYTNNFLLFKEQAKLLGGNAVNRANTQGAKTSFEKLVEQSKHNQADHKFVNIVKRYGRDERFIITTDGKCKVNFITEHILDSKCVQHKKDIKKIGINKVIAYLDTDHTDILFTTEGLYAYRGLLKSTASYNSGKIKFMDNRRIEIDGIAFKHEQVNMKMLDEMITELRNLAPRETEANIAFEQKVGEFSDTLIYVQDAENLQGTE